MEKVKGESNLELTRKKLQTLFILTPKRRRVISSPWLLTGGQVSPSAQQAVDENGKERSVESEHWRY